MPTTSNTRLAFGPNKYAAFHLMLARWLRQCASPGPYSYVTLGGTQLRDIPSVAFVDSAFAGDVWSYENDAGRFQVAQQTATELRSEGMTLQLQQSSLWSHKRTSNTPHLFYVDLLGICAWSDYDERFGELFQNEVIREGDGLLITSHLGHNLGLPAIRSHFGGEFDVLGIDSSNDATVKSVFRRAHPSLTLFKALSLNGIQSELSVRCFGAVKYKDNSPMGIYGYCIAPGTTDLSKLVQDHSTIYFDLKSGRICPAERF